MNALLVKLIKNLLFQDVTKAGQDDKDKPLLEKKRWLGAIGVLLSTLVGYMGYQFDPATVVLLADSINQLITAGKQIFGICQQSWPLLTGIYFTLLGVVGIFDKNSRDRIAEIFGDPKPADEVKK